ncbi:unnamed protein product [Closterium sp. Naga37s-1]|nr:unnamed protein product [Closterium sp. Naga37s-1]
MAAIPSSPRPPFNSQPLHNRVNGDTNVALEQVQQSPTMSSAMVKYLHCIPSEKLLLTPFSTLSPPINIHQSPTPQSLPNQCECEKLLNATRYARYTAATVLTTANSSVVSNAPMIFAFLGVPGGICVPYGPAPNFTRDTDLCVKGTILFPQFVNVSGTCADVPFESATHSTNTTLFVTPLPPVPFPPVPFPPVPLPLYPSPCPPPPVPLPLSPYPCPPSHCLPPPSLQVLMTTAGNTALVPEVMLMTTAGNTPLVPEVVRNDLTATAQTLELLESTIPNVLTLIDCSYVANIAAVSEGNGYQPSDSLDRLPGFLLTLSSPSSLSPLPPHSLLSLLTLSSPSSLSPLPPHSLLSLLTLSSPSSPLTPHCPLSLLSLVSSSPVNFAISEGQAMVTNFQMLWVGFLVIITIACMMQAPFYHMQPYCQITSSPLPPPTVCNIRGTGDGDLLPDALDRLPGFLLTLSSPLSPHLPVPVAYPAGGEGGGLTQVNEPSFAEGSDNSYAGESGAGYK